MDEKLKPCPLCGGEADLKRGLYVIDNYVMCKACKTKTTLYNTKDEAIKRWNTRKTYMGRIAELLEENAHKTAVVLAETFGYNCPCNFNGIDEWFPEVCDLGEFCPDGKMAVIASWEQYIKVKLKDLREGAK